MNDMAQAPGATPQNSNSAAPKGLEGGPMKLTDKKREAKRQELLQTAKEICGCGHSRIAHQGAIFHGRCLIGRSETDFCACPKFTWARTEA